MLQRGCHLHRHVGEDLVDPRRQRGGATPHEDPLGPREHLLVDAIGTRAVANGALHRIQHLDQADSVRLDFHKTGFAPYVSSLFLARDEADLQQLVRGRADLPCQFQSGEHHPGLLSLETSRSGSGVLAALGSLRLLGKTGLRPLLEHLEGHRIASMLNGENFDTVTLFRVYPDGVDT